jgi:TolB-like protein
MLYRQSNSAGNLIAAPLNSIAVLPLKNLSGDATQEYLGDGVAESLISALARAKGLKVIARTSAFAFKGREMDVREIGRQLGVSAVLEGSLRRSTEQLRIELRLVNTADGQVVWTDELNPAGTGDLLAVQDEIACSVANNLRLLLCNEAEQRLARHHTRNAAAYQAYLKGRYHWYRRTPDDMRQALAAFEDAIRADPQYALAYCGLAETHGIMQVNRQVAPNSVVTKTKTYAQQALALDSTLARPYAILGLLAGFVEWDWLASERLLKRALELDPGYAYALGWYANTLQAQGRLAEAEKILRQAIELDPLSLSLHNSLGENYYYAGQHERLLEQAQMLAARDPQNQNARHLLFCYHMAKGNYDEAARWLEQGEMTAGAQFHYLLVMGKKTEALRRLTDLTQSAQAEHYPFGIARLYALLGDKEAVFNWLQRAYEQRDADLSSLKVEPVLANLRAEPRYRELLRRVGLPE